jgi:hypothetical protein
MRIGNTSFCVSDYSGRNLHGDHFPKANVAIWPWWKIFALNYIKAQDTYPITVPPNYTGPDLETCFYDSTGRFLWIYTRWNYNYVFETITGKLRK